jgi:glycosyltransferase involved in cell wall biosynthesis
LKKHRVDILVPCFNPQSDWAATLLKRYQSLSAALVHEYELHLILVNDGSTQGMLSSDLATLRKEVPGLLFAEHTTNQGKGAALRTAAQMSSAPYALFTDIDFPYTQQSVITVLQTLTQHGGIVCGHREQTYYEKVPLVRRWLSKLLRLMLKYFLRLPVTDSQCGLKAMDQSGRDIFLQTTINRYLFDLEFLQKANGKVPVTAVRVELRDGIIFTAMSLRILRTEFGNFLRLLF